LEKDGAPHINLSAEVDIMPATGCGFFAECCRITSCVPGERTAAAIDDSDALQKATLAFVPKDTAIGSRF
jgi:hypothetical protein